ncbi:tail fiber domain-containing protein [Hymenobacter negativus]|uniref:Tail fiber domain-containing protein n=1 Tax=Hymenobacter negativus TaxID=2795026 RepID=A0ABS3QHT9_9BACT|nr:tail fiber domain-containing protein [Hymenobacter negativus]MBO2010804.1 tail fiber domain-containing protein [Hymenobacter negativus]
MKTIFRSLFLLMISAAAHQAAAQVGIGTLTPDASAALEIRATNKGLLIPQVTLTSLTDGNTIPTPGTGLLVFNRNAAISGGVGFYYNAGTAAAPSWTKLSTGTAPTGSDWSLTGNAATDSIANFLVTNDVKPVRLGINGQEKARLHTNSAFWLGGDPLGSASFPDNQLLIGYQAGKKLPTISFNNPFMGYQAGLKTTSKYNQFSGFQVGHSNTTADGNYFVGFQAGINSTSGGGNTLLGFLVGHNVATGADNTALDNQAGTTVSGGSNNLFLGVGADASQGNITNATAIGANSRVGGNNLMAFGTSTNTWIFGRSTIGSSAFALQVGTNGSNGNGAYLSDGGTWTNASDINLKENIQPVEGAQVLGLIRELPLSRWTYEGTNDEIHLGPMAQDFYRLLHLGLNDTSVSTIDPAGMALVGVQELARQSDALKAENAQLRQQLQAEQTGQNALDARLAALEQGGARSAAALVAQATR